MPFPTQTRHGHSTWVNNLDANRGAFSAETTEARRCKLAQPEAISTS